MLQPLLWILLGSFEVESIILDMAVSVIHIASDPVAQLCVCVVVVTQMPGVWSIEPQDPGFRNPAWLMRVFTLSADGLRSSTVL